MPPWLDDAVIVGMLTLLATTVTTFVNAHLNGRGHRLKELDTTVQVLSARVTTLEEKLTALERSEEEARRVKWHAVEYARAVLAWAHDLIDLLPSEVSPPPEPPVPEALIEDL